MRWDCRLFSGRPTVVRVIALILLFATQGFIVIAYLLSALIIPEKSTKSKSSAAKTENTNSVVESLQIKSTKSENFLNYTGAGLILLGVWLLLEQLFPSIFRWDWRIVVASNPGTNWTLDNCKREREEIIWQKNP
jgi:hypothetical protein